MDRPVEVQAAIDRQLSLAESMGPHAEMYGDAPVIIAYLYTVEARVRELEAALATFGVNYKVILEKEADR